MKLWLKLLTCAAVAFGAQAHAQNKTVTLVVPYPTGGAADQMARVIAQEMNEKHGYTMIVDNRPGAGAQVAMNVIKGANPAAGTMLLLADSAAFSLNQHLYSRLNYDAKKDLIPITMAAIAPVFLLVNKDSPIQDVQDLVKLGKQKELTFGSPGVGTGTHLLGEMLRKKTGAQLMHVPYRGAAPALIDAVSGQIDFIFDVLTGSRAFIEDGRLRIVAAASPERNPLRPNVPTLTERGIPDVNFSIWWGIAARAGTPPEQVKQISGDLLTVLKDQAVVKRFVDLGIQIQPTTAEAFAQLIDKDAKTYGPIIKDLNIKLD